MYTVALTKLADRTLRKLPRNVANLIRAKIDEIAADPYGQHNNVTKLTGRDGYRVRVGDWRVLYELQDQQLVMLVVKIGPRGSVYA
ncbi:MAG: type II toxin-antitoxin system RelE/ParE family toxin [Chloroflexota bacterium]|jgi:mRNA interferase RelE/StbE|nr:type II toxin-antitoxin system RelE/ParE family toxin [Chloroflexota bacterium]